MRYFLDTEFNGMGGDLISLALAAEDGRELYLAIQCNNPGPWAAANVIPIINCDGALPLMLVKTPTMIGMAVDAFMERDSDPVIIADWPDDIAYFCKTLITGPGEMVNIPSLKFEIIRVDAYPTMLPGAIQHNALWDARALRHKVMGLDQ